MTISELKRQDKKFANRYKLLRYRTKKRRLEKYGSLICVKCGFTTKEMGAGMTVDHIESLEDGGKNEKSNLQMLCIKCHLKKNKYERK